MRGYVRHRTSSLRVVVATKQISRVATGDIGGVRHVGDLNGGAIARSEAMPGTEVHVASWKVRCEYEVSGAGVCGQALAVDDPASFVDDGGDGRGSGRWRRAIGQIPGERGRGACS